MVPEMAPALWVALMGVLGASSERLTLSEPSELEGLMEGAAYKAFVDGL